VTDEAQFKATLKLLPKHVDAPPGQLVVQVRDDEVESYGQFSVHRDVAAAAADDEGDDDDNSGQDARNTRRNGTLCEQNVTFISLLLSDRLKQRA